MQKLDMPVSFPTSCCFGGPNYNTMFVTSGRVQGDDDLRKTQPQAGAVFSINGLGVKGLPPHEYVG